MSKSIVKLMSSVNLRLKALEAAGISIEAGKSVTLSHYNSRYCMEFSESLSVDSGGELLLGFEAHGNEIQLTDFVNDEVTKLIVSNASLGLQRLGNLRNGSSVFISNQM